MTLADTIFVLSGGALLGVFAFLCRIPTDIKPAIGHWKMELGKPGPGAFQPRAKLYFLYLLLYALGALTTFLAIAEFSEPNTLRTVRYSDLFFLRLPTHSWAAGAGLLSIAITCVGSALRLSSIVRLMRRLTPAQLDSVTE